MLTKLKQRVSYVLDITLLGLASLALIAEILPEVSAKLIVVPTLILAIIIVVTKIRRKKLSKQVDEE